MKASELNLQGTCYQWAYNTYQEVRGILHHIPNGGKRSIVEAAQLKASGVVMGVCDLFLPLARRNAHGLYIEMKLPGEKLRSEQVMFADKVSKNGYFVYRIDNVEEFKELIEWYLGHHEIEPSQCKFL
jgi:hypothetical protein